MMISVRTKLFDADTPKEEGAFHGEDFAKWLQPKLANWKTSIFSEDWGWGLDAKRGDYHYIIGIYDHDTEDVNEHV